MKQETRNKLNDVLKGLILSKEQKDRLVEVFEEVGQDGGNNEDEIPSYDITHIINSADLSNSPVIITQDEGFMNIFDNNETFKIIMDVSKVFGQNDIYIITMNKCYIRDGKKCATGDFSYIVEYAGATTGGKLNVTINKYVNAQNVDVLEIIMGVI